MQSKKLFTFLFMIGVLAASCQCPTRLQPIALSPADAAGSLAPGNYGLTLGPDGDQRKVILHIPPAYDKSSKLPLVIVLHGGGGSAEQVQRQSQMDRYADQFGFVVAYPNGSGRLEDAIFTWNSGHCCGYALEHNVDDVGFLIALIDSLNKQYAIDPNRVYVTGMSNGAMMAYRTGAELADKIAGIAPVAGTIGGQVRYKYPPVFPDDPSEPVSVIAFTHARSARFV
jgi:polyhydroxybutyrate depolymerase